MSLDLDILHRIVEAIFPIIYPALRQMTLPPNTITSEMVAGAARFHISDHTGVLCPEPPHSAPPSVAAVASSTLPDAYWIVEKLAEASLLASRDPEVTEQRESSRAGRASASGARSPLPPPAELLRAFHAFMLTLTGASTPATLSETIAAARASQKPPHAPPAKKASREARSQATLVATGFPPAAPSAPPGAQTAPNAGAPEKMASDAETTDAPCEEVDYDAIRQVLNVGLDDVATSLIGSHARRREAPGNKMPLEPARGKLSGHSSKKCRKLQTKPEPATKTAPENIVRV